MPVARRIRVLLVVVVLLAATASASDRATGATTGGATVTVDVPDVTTIGATGCLPGVVGTTAFGSIPAGTTTWGSGDCHVTWSTNEATAMLRMYQTDGAGTAMTSASSFVPDYVQGTTDWSMGAGAFGACLRTVGATTAAVWDDDATCTQSDGTHWQGIPASSADLDSRVASSDDAGEVRIQFGLRTPNGQLAEAYAAGITFAVVAPDPGPGAVPTAGTVAATGTAALGQTLTATPSGWFLGTPAGSYTYQWIRCGTGGNTCVDIAGETGSTYVVSGADGGRTIRVRAEVTNVHGSATATSPQTTIIIDSVGSEAGTSASTVANATSLNVTKPANTFEGDILVAHVVVRDGTDVIFTTVPAGWVLIRRTDETDRVATASYYKILTAAEPAGYTWQWNVSDRATIGVQAFSAVDHTSPIAADSGLVGESTTATAPSVVVPTANSILLAMYGTRDTVTFTDNSGMNAMWNLAGGGGNIGAFGRWQLVAAGATGTRSAGLSATSEWAAQLVALRPRP